LFLFIYFDYCQVAAMIPFRKKKKKVGHWFIVAIVLMILNKHFRKPRHGWLITIKHGVFKK